MTKGACSQSMTRAAARDEPTDAASRKRFVRAVFASGRPEAEVRALVDGALRMPLAASIALFPRDIPREYWREVVRSIELPLLYAVSAQFQEQAWNLRLQRPRTQVEVFHRSGHALFADEPDRFNRLLIHFARKIGSQGA